MPSPFLELDTFFCKLGQHAFQTAWTAISGSLVGTAVQYEALGGAAGGSRRTGDLGKIGIAVLSCSRNRAAC